MKIRRKVVSQLLLTDEEVNVLLDLVTKAQTGQTVHYAEHQLPNGQFFGVGIDPNANEPEPTARARFEKVSGNKKY